MKRDDLINTLDNYFGVHGFEEEGTVWQGFMSDVYKSQVQPFFVQEFWEGHWNGLMLDNAAEVDRIYLVVFPTARILDTIIAKEVERGAHGAMIFAHHPLAYDEKGSGFISIPAEQLEELREHRISFYNCHAPLDCHPVTSTGNALANALGLNDIKRFGAYRGGLAGVHGMVPPIPFNGFAERLAKVCELPALRYDQILHNGQPVHHVAVVAGGGGNRQFIDEAISLGIDTYITGHWHLFADNAFSTARREEFKDYLPGLKINLLGASHYSSEMVVMRDQMRNWFSKIDLESVLIKQENPWGI